MVELNEPNCQRFKTTLITFLILYRRRWREAGASVYRPTPARLV